MTQRTKPLPLFPAFTTSYLKVLGELLIVGSRLQQMADSGAGASDVWRLRAEALLDEIARIGTAAATGAGDRAVRVVASDGSLIVADLEYLNGLVRKLHRHCSVGALHASTRQDAELAVS